MASFSGYLVSDSTINWSFSGLEHPVSEYSFRVSTSDGNSASWSYGADNEFTYNHACGITVVGSGYATWGGTEYFINSYSVSTQACPLPVRPSSFSWTTSKTSGGNFNVSASEWTNLQNNINSVRSYKNMYAYSFTTVSYGQNFEAYLFNQAVSSISEMNPPISTPSTVVSGQTIYASYLNGLVNSINSIS
jgi:hypothetical protein